MDLPGHGEAVPCVERGGFPGARGRGAEEEPDAVLAVVHAVAEDVDGALVADFPPEAGQEPAADVVVRVDAQGPGCLRLGVMQGMPRGG